MVLQNYSWQDFMLAAIAILVLWYAGIWVYFKWRDSVKLRASEPLSHSWQVKVDQLSAEEDVMGETKLDRGVQVVSADEFSFIEGEQMLEKSDQLGMIPDVQQEIKSICTLLAEKDGTKEDFFSMFEMLVRGPYPEIPAASIAGLKSFTREHVPFHLSDEELDSLWS